MPKISDNQREFFYSFMMLKRQRLDPARKRETNEHTRHSAENPEGQHCSHKKKPEVGLTLPKVKVSLELVHSMISLR